MRVRPKLVVVSAAAAIAVLLALGSQRLGDVAIVTEPHAASPPGAAQPSASGAKEPKDILGARGPTAAVFAARVEGFLPTLEHDVAAGSAQSRETSADCAFAATYRSTEIGAIERDLLDGGHFGEWTDAEARSLAALVAESLGPLRRCVACGPRGGCGAAARVLVRLENALAAYRRSADRSGT